MGRLAFRWPWAPAPTKATDSQTISVWHLLGIQPWDSSEGVSSGRAQEIVKAWAGLVYKCLDLRANAMAEAEIQLIDVKDEVLKDHPLYSLLDDPNPLESGDDLIYRTCNLRDSMGDCYWLNEKNIFGEPMGIRILRPEWMKFVGLDMMTGEAQWEYTEGGYGAPKPIPGRYVAHYKLPHPYNAVYGASVILRAALDIDLDVLMARSSLGVLNNKSIPPIYLKTEQEVQPGEGKQIIAEWEARMMGPEKSGRTAFLHKGTEVKAIEGIDLTQLMYLDARVKTRERLCAIFGVPESMLGWISDANRSNMDAVERGFLKRTVQPLARSFGAVIQQQVLPWFGKSSERLRVRVNLDIPEDMQFKLNKLKDGMTLGVYNADQWRADFGEPKRPDGGGNQYYTLANLIPEGTFTLPPATEPPKAFSVVEPQKMLPAKQELPFPKSLLKTHEAREKQARMSDRLREAWVAAVARDMEKFMDAQAKRLLAALRRTKADKPPPVDDSDLAAIMIAMEAEDAALVAALAPMMERVVITFGTGALEGLPSAPSYQAARALAVVADDLPRRSRLINETTAEKLREILQQGMADGIGGDEMGRRIRAYFTDMTEWRSKLIARTETGRASTIAKQDAWKQFGAPGREWVEFPGNRGETNAEPVHLAANGAMARTGEPYVLAGMAIMGPRMSGDPGVDCNCFPGDILVQSTRIIAAFRRFYQGELVEIQTAGGMKLAATPNHPILTRSGWVGLGELDEGSEIIYCTNSKALRRACPDMQNKQAPLKDVFRTLADMHSLHRISGIGSDFHGDGRDEEIQIIRAKGKFAFSGYASSLQHLGEAALANTGLRFGALATFGSGSQFAFAGTSGATGDIGSFGEFQSYSGRRLGHTGIHRFSSVPVAQASLMQDAIDRSPINAIEAGERLDALAGVIAADKVIAVRRYPFAGHVYNLQTRTGWYLSNGVITHNCRCDEIPVTDASVFEETGE